jgi:hypothetical protein
VLLQSHVLHSLGRPHKLGNLLVVSQPLKIIIPLRL